MGCPHFRGAGSGGLALSATTRSVCCKPAGYVCRGFFQQSNVRYKDQVSPISPSLQVSFSVFGLGEGSVFGWGSASGAAL